MREVEISLPAGVQECAVINTIESVFASRGLSTVLKSSMAAYPGSLHWHVKCACGHGTLELTYWPRESHAWFLVHDNRKAPWIDEFLPIVQEKVEAGLASKELLA
jgi:hypothetical protein